MCRRLRMARAVTPLINHQYTTGCGPGSVVGIATAYGLEGPGIESR